MRRPINRQLYKSIVIFRHPVSQASIAQMGDAVAAGKVDSASGDNWYTHPKRFERREAAGVRCGIETDIDFVVSAE